MCIGIAAVLNNFLKWNNDDVESGNIMAIINPN